MMTLSRRDALGGLALAGLGGALLTPAAAHALSEDEAIAFVESVADDMRAIAERATSGDPQTEAFLDLLRSTTAIEAVGRFTMGLNWREMSAAQQERFLDAFERYAARVYARRIGDYRGQSIEIDGAQDVGRKGVLVKTRFKSPDAQDVAVEWLVNDREGTTKLVDVVAEGVSLSISQREEFAAMVDKRGGDIDAFIDDLDKL
jgi:phospholipid transport system substrate-binding protein